MLPTTYSRIRQGIFAVAEISRQSSEFSDLDHFGRILGTGFIVGDSVGLTCMHVLNYHSPCNSRKLIALLFLNRARDLEVVQADILSVSPPRSSNSSGMDEGLEPDLALVTLNYRGLSRFSLELDAEQALDGTEIATAGFPLGMELIASAGEVERFGPVLQRGIVSASVPYFSTAASSYVINIMVQGGASGSPVFRTDTGRVIGVITNMQITHDTRLNGENQEIRSQVTNFGYADSTQKVFRFFPELRVPSLLPQRLDLPSIDEWHSRHLPVPDDSQ